MKNSANAYQTLVLKAFSGKGLDPIAESVGVDKATISRLKNEHLERFCKVLEQLDLKIVPTKYKCYPADEIEIFITMAKKYMAQLESARELEWEE